MARARCTFRAQMDVFADGEERHNKYCLHAKHPVAKKTGPDIFAVVRTCSVHESDNDDDGGDYKCVPALYEWYSNRHVPCNVLHVRVCLFWAASALGDNRLRLEATRGEQSEMVHVGRKCKRERIIIEITSWIYYIKPLLPCFARASTVKAHTTHLWIGAHYIR